MITEENGVFHIRTETDSYLFKINAYGLAEHLHFGAPVKTSESPLTFTPAVEPPFAAAIFAFISAARSERLP